MIETRGRRRRPLEGQEKTTCCRVRLSRLPLAFERRKERAMVGKAVGVGGWKADGLQQLHLAAPAVHPHCNI